ncbi:MAG: class I SAM-dependent methyltransferase [Blastocatellia bacterium]|nr:class I SAM-dependent methyltransferase [Blastocatellia bacterium]MBL8195346.1 class I SAM-dependent methyltransferase [Blastocatellia bacterium]
MNNNVTRGHGLLEGFLANQRIKMANKLIIDKYRQGKLLDIGCGSYPLFLTKVEFSQKYGLDKMVQPSQIETLKKQNINLINYDSEENQSLPFEDNFFDVVTMLAVFEHIEPVKLPNLLREIKRILKPNGIYILTTPAVWTDGLLRFLAKLNLVSPAEIEEHKDAYSHKKIAQFLTKADFQKEKLQFGYFELFMNVWATATK